MRSAYPVDCDAWIDEAADSEIGALIEVVRAVRNIRSENGIAPKVELDVYLSAGEPTEALRSQSIQYRGREAGEVGDE